MVVCKYVLYLYQQKQTKMIQLTKIAKGKYYDRLSSNCIYKTNNIWFVMQECTGEVYFSAKTLKECKTFQKSENEIKSWNN